MAGGDFPPLPFHLSVKHSRAQSDARTLGAFLSDGRRLGVLPALVAGVAPHGKGVHEAFKDR